MKLKTLSIFLIFSILFSFSQAKKNTDKPFLTASKIKNENSTFKLQKYIDKTSHLFAKTSSMSSFPGSKPTPTSARTQNAQSYPIAASIKQVESWGTLNFIEDNTPITFVQNHSISFSIGVSDYFDSVQFTFYNTNLQEGKTIRLNLPDTTNSVDILPTITRRYFNNDAKFEFVLHIHYFVGEVDPSNQADEIWIVNEDGKILQQYKGVNGIFLFNETAPYYAKIALVNARYISPKVTIDTCYISMYSLGDLNTPEHVFSLPWNLLDYYNGNVITEKVIDNTIYLVSTHYEKIFAKNMSDELGNIEITPNNKFIVNLYDRDYNLVKEIKLDLIGQDKNPISMITLGMFTADQKWDLTKSIFNTDTNFEILYGLSRYYTDCDCEKIDYFLVDEHNTVLHSIPDPLSYTRSMANLFGHEDQVALCLGGSEITGFKFLDLPSWTYGTSFDAIHNKDLLSMDFERCIVGNDYQYVFFLGKGEVDAANNVLASVVWYDRKASEQKRVKFNTGPQTVLASIPITSEMLNPYTFSSTGEQTYVVLTKENVENQTQISIFLSVIKEDGTVLARWSDDDTLGKLFGGGFYADENNEITKLYITYEGNNYKTSANFYNLPFTQFQGGDGTKTNPYLIASAGDLNLIRFYPTAYFRIIKDIDLANFPVSDGLGWMPIGNSQNPFVGTLDGGNHKISHLQNRRPSIYANGLFGVLGEKSNIQNLILDSVDLVGGNSLGGIVGEVFNSIISNCEVHGSLQNAYKIGGIAGFAVLETKISICQFDGQISGDRDNETCGGIVGSIRSGASVRFCHTSGSIKNGNDAGGLIGNLGAGTVGGNLSDSYATMDVSGLMNVGGVIGVSYLSSPRNLYSTGRIIANGNPNVAAAGGLIGQNNPSHGTAFSKCLLAVNDSISSSFIAGRIVGWNDNDPSASGLDSNYADAAICLGVTNKEIPVSDTSLKSVNGKSIARNQINQALLESISWKFGSDTLQPWTIVSNQLPRLWYEFLVKGIRISKSSLQLNPTETAQINAQIFPTDALNKEITWTSTDTSIASVDNTGLITAIRVGKTSIVAHSQEGNFTDSCQVSVGYPVSGISLNHHSLSLLRGQSETLIAHIIPEDATNKNVKWSSNAPSIASVDATGKVMGLIPGIAQIKVSTVDGNFSDTCLLTIQPASIENTQHKALSIYTQKSQIIIESVEPLRHITIYDNIGRIVYKQASNTQTNLISTSEWSRGVYLIHALDMHNKSMLGKVSIY
ncbi:MAG: Ig-like domain-containing protein [Bacteroidales bacterium]